MQNSFYWLQYKRGLSSPPVFSPAFQASARSIRIFHLLLINSQIRKFVKKGSGRNLDIKIGLFWGLNVQGQLPP